MGRPASAMPPVVFAGRPLALILNVFSVRAHVHQIDYARCSIASVIFPGGVLLIAEFDRLSACLLPSFELHARLPSIREFDASELEGTSKLC